MRQLGDPPMRPALFLPSSVRDRESLRRRAIAVVLTILAHVLLLLMLLRLAPDQFGVPKGSRLATFSLMPEQDASEKHVSTVDRSKPRSGGAPHQPPPPRPEHPVEVPPPPTPAQTVNILPLTRQEMAAADISRLHSDMGKQVSGQGDAAAGEGAGSDSGGTMANVPGAGNVRLYNAEWYREPTQTELDFYLPKNRSTIGTALIACQTIARFHVDNCQELGDSPAGSGLAYAMTQAAWQFLVRPPRVGGHPEIGAWVRIRIEFTERGATKGG